jgi:hypothetical protein
LYWSRRTTGLGLTILRLHAGSSGGILPPQKCFTVDFGHGLLYRDLSFKTLGETNFSGDRAATVYMFHDFGRILFRRSRIPLVKEIPFSLGVFGGLFWTDFENSDYVFKEYRSLFARKAYSEIGFQLGGIPPFGVEMNFTWQLSDYPSDCPLDHFLDYAPAKFSLGMGMALFDF